MKNLRFEFFRSCFFTGSLHRFSQNDTNTVLIRAVNTVLHVGTDVCSFFATQFVVEILFKVLLGLLATAVTQYLPFPMPCSRA